METLEEEVEGYLKQFGSCPENMSYVKLYEEFVEAMKKRGKKPKNVCKGNEMLIRCRATACAIAARDCLECLRSCVLLEDYQCFVHHLRCCLLQANLAMEDIGSSEEELRQIQLYVFKERYESCQALAQSGNPQWRVFIRRLLRKINAAGFKLKDIGATTDEVKAVIKQAKEAEKEFKRQRCIRNMQRHARRFRYCTDVWGYYFERLKGYLAERDLTFADIGITDRDIANYHLRSAKEAASDYLVVLRTGTMHYARCILYLRQELRRRGFSLEDVGISEKEIARLKSKGCRVAAQRCLQHLRDGHDYRIWSRMLKRELKQGGLSITDIGGSRHELKELKQAQLLV